MPRSFGSSHTAIKWPCQNPTPPGSCEQHAHMHICLSAWSERLMCSCMCNVQKPSSQHNAPEACKHFCIGLVMLTQAHADWHMCELAMKMQKEQSGQGRCNRMKVKRLKQRWRCKHGPLRHACTLAGLHAKDHQGLGERQAGMRAVWGCSPVRACAFGKLTPTPTRGWYPSCPGRARHNNYTLQTPRQNYRSTLLIESGCPGGR